MHVQDACVGKQGEAQPKTSPSDDGKSDSSHWSQLRTSTPVVRRSAGQPSTQQPSTPDSGTNVNSISTSDSYHAPASEESMRNDCDGNYRAPCVAVCTAQPAMDTAQLAPPPSTVRLNMGPGIASGVTAPFQVVKAHAAQTRQQRNLQWSQSPEAELGTRTYASTSTAASDEPHSSARSKTHWSLQAGGTQSGFTGGSSLHEVSAASAYTLTSSWYRIPGSSHHLAAGVARGSSQGMGRVPVQPAWRPQEMAIPRNPSKGMPYHAF